MEPDFSFFTPGENPLLDAVDFQAAFPASHYYGIVGVLAVLLAYAAYTDLFKGNIIRNTTVAAIAAACLAIVPMVITDLSSHAIGAGISIVVLLALSFGGVMKEGDLKIFGALSILLGPAILVMVLVSFFFIAIYGSPYAIKTSKRKKADKKAGIEVKRKDYLTHIPAGPGIALALPATMALAGIDMQYIVLTLIAEIVSLIFFMGLSSVSAKAEALEKEQEEAQKLEEASIDKETIPLF